MSLAFGGLCDGLNLLINVCLLCGFLVTVVWRLHFLFVVLEWLYGPALLCFVFVLLS